MLKDFSWAVFEKTGSVESFLVYNELKKIDGGRNLNKAVNTYAVNSKGFDN